MKKESQLDPHQPVEGRGRPVVSIVVPTIRVDALLVEAVDSLLNQTTAELEIVIVIDGSREDVPETWRADDRVVIERLPERVGTPSALNRGIEISSAPYIGRLDADDIALPHRFEAQLAVLERHPDLVCLGSSAILIDEGGDRLGVLEAPTGAETVRRTLLSRNAMTHSSVIVRRAAMNAIGGYDPTCTRMQDYDLFLRLAAVGEIDNLADPLVMYRVHPGQHSRATKPWAPYMGVVLRERRALARVMRVPLVTQMFRDALWWSMQVARHFGLIRAGYLRRGAIKKTPKQS